MKTSNACERLTQIRKVLNMQYSDFSQAVDLTINQIKNREFCRTKIDKMFALLLKEKLNVNPEWLLYGEGDLFLKKLNIPDKFIERVNNDIIKKPNEFENNVKFKEKVRYFLKKYVRLSRKEVIQLAQALKEPIDEYLDLAGYIPNSLLELYGENRKLNILFRKMGELTAEDLDSVLNTVETVVDAYVAKYKKKEN